MPSRWSAVVVAALGLLGCGGDSVSAESSASDTSGGETDGLDEDDICVTMLDPEVYTSPAWSPAPLPVDPACPAVDGNIHLELPAPVLVTGTTRLGGVPAEANLYFVRRSDDTHGWADVELDGAFEAWVLPGRYDVYIGMPPDVIGHSTLAFEDIDLSSATELVVDGPAPITITGTMTIDGEIAADPQSYIRLVPTGGDTSQVIDLRMATQTYEVTVGPGSYDILYSWCDYTHATSRSFWIFCEDFGDLPWVPHDQVNAGPVQLDQRFLTGLVFEADATFDVDVPTVTISGTVRADGAPLSEGSVQLRRDGQIGLLDEGLGYPGAFDSSPDEAGQWGGRVVAGRYDVHFDSFTGPVHEDLLIDQDTVVDLDLERITISGSFPTTSPITTYGQPNGYGDSDIYAGLELQSVVDVGSLRVPMWDGKSAEFEQQLFAGRYQVTLDAEWCWSDPVSNVGHRGSPILARDLDLQDSVELDLELEPERLARVSVSVDDPSHPVFPLSLRAIGDPPSTHGSQYFGGGDLVYGVMVAGRYRVFYGTYTDVVLGEIDIVDGTSVVVEVESAVVSMTLSVGAQSVDPTGRVYLMTDEGESIGLYEPGMLAPPGRYHLVLGTKTAAVGQIMPINRMVELGCVTLGSR